jgi:hypothetical protein
MGADMTLGMVPAVEMTDDRCANWDSICESLDDLDEGYDVYEFLDGCETHEDKINALKALKEEYGQRVSNNYRDIHERTIQGVRYLFSGAMSWGDDLPESAELFMNIEGISEIFDWLEQEALEDMKRAKTLDLAKAEQYLNDGDSIDFDELTDITVDAAEVLAKHNDWLCLDGLKSLSDKAAEALSKHDFSEGLSLRGLNSLSDAAVKALSQPNKAELILGLTRLSDAAAESLSKYEGGLSLDSLTDLSATAAESLSKHQGGLSLNGLTELSDEAIGALVNCQGWLYLNGLSGLTDAAVETLAQHEGDLSLEALMELSDAAAQSLAQHKGDLYLGVKELSEPAAQSLAQHEGNINLKDPAEWVKSMREELSGTLHVDSDYDPSNLTKKSLAVFEHVRDAGEIKMSNLVNDEGLLALTGNNLVNTINLLKSKGALLGGDGK